MNHSMNPTKDNRLLAVIVAVLLGLAGAAVLVTLAMSDGPKERTRLSQTLGSDTSTASGPVAPKNANRPATVIDTGPAELTPVDPASVIAEPWPETPPSIEPIARVQPAQVVAPATPVTEPAVVIAAPEDSFEPARKPLVEIVESAFGVGVEDRTPVGVGTTFDTAADKVWAWVKINNGGAPTTIQMVWRRDGEVAATVSLKVGTSSGWRTWSNKNVHGWDIGAWEVDVLDANGTLVDSMSFDIVRAAHVEQG
jgi:hypothetical protein